MKRIFIVLLLLLLQNGFLLAQYKIKDQDELKDLKVLSLEKIYVHANTPLLFPGEYLYYSIYCLNAATNRLDNISRMAYVELVGEDLMPVFRQKVRLDGGRGQGDFFVPVSVPSGNYKLIAYTQWMKNAGIGQLFQDNIMVINPYRADQESILTQTDIAGADHMQHQDLKKGEPIQDLGAPITEDRSILLLTDRENYGKRDKVQLTPKNFRGPLGYGNYSISVRRKDDLATHGTLNALDFTAKYLDAKKSLPQGVNDSIYLPEQRGELFFGSVTDMQNKPVAGMTVVISIPGKDFQLKSAITDDQGIFYTYVNKEYDGSVLLAQVPGNNDGLYHIAFKDRSGLDYGNLQFENLKIGPEDEKSILQRSVYNQIENGYFSVKPDSILSIDTLDPFDGGLPEVVVLDDFTRFPTLKETLVEVVPNVWVKRLENGNDTFWVKEALENYENDFASDPPLVLVDGVFVPDHNALLESNAMKIEKISILREPLVLGSNRFLGMVAIETINGDYLENLDMGHIGQQDLMMPTAKKNYYRQLYTPETIQKYERIPDFRQQLFWMPQMQFSNVEPEVVYEFYTSDVPGVYEIVLEGFTTYGKPISVKASFSVE